jgi:hypothetical protein
MSLAFGSWILAIGFDFIDPRVAMLVALLSVLSFVIVRPFIRCRRCGASAFLYNRWVGGPLPPKACYRCGQDFSTDR